MNVNNLLHKIKPPCDKCPYTLGQIQTTVNPCPQCKLNSYQSYEWFLKQLTKAALDEEESIE